MRTINIASMFSRHPAGRYAEDGPFSGQTFRETVLEPALNEHEKISIEFDTAAGFGSSFLEEAFGGLVRNHVATAAELHEKLNLISDDNALINEIWEYVDQADTLVEN